MKGKEMIKKCSNKCRAKSRQINHAFCLYHARVQEIADLSNKIMGFQDFASKAGPAHDLFLSIETAKKIKAIANKLRNMGHWVGFRG